MAVHKKHVFKWHDHHVIQFLEQYKQQECLWNVHVRGYKNRFERERAYKTILNNLKMENITLQDIKNKIKGIRTTYSDEINKVWNSEQSGAEEVYVPKVFWFELADTFLRGVTSRRKTAPLAPQPREDDNSVITYEEEQNDQDEYIYPVEEAATPPAKQVKRMHQESLESPKLDNYPMTEFRLTHNGDDEFDLFCRSLAIQLKKLPELDALELMQKMQMMVINKKRELSILSTQTASCSQTEGRAGFSTGSGVLRKSNSHKAYHHNSSHFETSSARRNAGSDPLNTTDQNAPGTSQYRHIQLKQEIQGVDTEEYATDNEHDDNVAFTLQIDDNE